MTYRHTYVHKCTENSYRSDRWVYLVLINSNIQLGSIHHSPHIVFRSPYGIVPGGTHDQMGGSMNAFGENHILLFTIFNPLYPITVVSHTSWCVGKY